MRLGIDLIVFFWEELCSPVLGKIGYIRSDRKLIFTAFGSQLMDTLVRNGVDTFVETYKSLFFYNL